MCSSDLQLADLPVGRGGGDAIRGGIVDIFALTEELPYRIELWGDEVDSIRTFDPDSQRSVDTMEEIVVYPAAELLLPKEQKSTVLQRIVKEGKKITERFRKEMKTQEAHRLQEAVDLLKEQVEVLSNVTAGGSEEIIIGDSPVMQQVFSTVEKLRDTDANILILGENGTGKDVIARMLYRNSPRYGKPFVTIDLGSIPEQLFESELFGYEKGAFTDARKAKVGRMEVATGGTLFLDEIGNLSLPMQAKLLTAIEKRCISRLGSTQATPIDVRLICATNADIRRLVDEGDFRQDLLYRINTIELHIPPLRERGNDILLLAEYFLQRYARKYQKEMRGLTREAKNKLLKYAWPGNVRELQHTVERAVILGDGSLLRPENFMFQASVSRQKKEEEVLNPEQLERQAVERAMRLSEGNVTRAAEYLGITRFALYRKLEKLGL